MHLHAYVYIELRKPSPSNCESSVLATIFYLSKQKKIS